MAQAGAHRTRIDRSMTAKKDHRVVLTQAELDRIRAKVGTTQETDAADVRRRYLKKLSDERVRLWPNTLEAQRQKKENWKRKQEEEIEARRRGVDQQEALLQRRQRVETIKRANDKLYGQTDKMKLLRSNLLLAGVIETRAEQAAEKVERHRQEEAQADAYHQEIMGKVAEGEDKNKALLEARKSKERALADMQQDQIKEYQAKYVAGLMKEKEEGDQIQREAKAAIEAEQQEAEARKRKMRVETEKMLATDKDLKARRAERVAEELADMEKRKQQQDTLDRAARARKSLEAKRFKERQAARQQMIDRAARDLEVRRISADTKQEKEAQEQRQKEDDAEAKKKQRRQDLMVEIDKSRAIQIEQRETQKREHRIENERIKSYFREKRVEMDQMLEEEKAVRLAGEKELRRFQQRQAKDRKANELAMEARDVVNHERMLASHEEENSRFNKVVHGHMDDFESQGRSSYLLHRALKHKNPIMFPTGKIKP